MWTRPRDVPAVPGVYRIWVGDQFYVGASCNVRQRFGAHKRDVSSAVCQAVQELGIKPKIEILKQFPADYDWQDLATCEKSWIDKFYGSDGCLNRTSQAGGLASDFEPLTFYIKHPDGRIEEHPEKLGKRQMSRVCGGQANGLGTSMNHVPAPAFGKGARAALTPGAFDMPANSDKDLEYRRAYQEKNKAKIAERGRAYYKKNRDKKAAYDRAYREKNKEKRAEQGRAWRERNRDRILKEQSTYRKENRDKLSDYFRARYAAVS